MTSRTMRGSTAATPGTAFERVTIESGARFSGHKDLRKSRIPIESLATGAQRLISRDRAYKDGNSRRDQQRDGNNLAPMALRSRRSFRSSRLTTAPHQTIDGAHCVLRQRCARHRAGARGRPCPAIAALWVIMIVVVPSRSFARTMAASTTLPVS